MLECLIHRLIKILQLILSLWGDKLPLLRQDACLFAGTETDLKVMIFDAVTKLQEKMNSSSTGKETGKNKFPADFTPPP